MDESLWVLVYVVGRLELKRGVEEKSGNKRNLLKIIEGDTLTNILKFPSHIPSANFSGRLNLSTPEEKISKMSSIVGYMKKWFLGPQFSM